MSVEFPTSDPTWDLEPIFEGGVESRAFDDEVVALGEDVDGLDDRLEGLALDGVDDFDRWQAVFDEYFAIQDRLSEANSFARAVASAHADDPKAVRLPSRLDDVRTAFRQIGVELRSVFRDVDDAVFDAMVADDRFSTMGLWLRELRRDAERAMSYASESLAVDLNRDGLHAWGRLYSEVTGRLEVDVEIEGEVETCSVGQAQNLMSDARRPVRAAAYEGLQEAWREVAPTCASALSSIRGTEQTLYRRRGGDYLTVPLDKNRVERSTLEAMFAATEEFRPLLERYHRAKARFMGLELLEWFDLPAPVGDDDDDIAYEDAQRFIVDQVEAISPKIASFCRRALSSRWVEAEDRGGKRQGGYCTSLPVSQEIRIFMTFGGTTSGVTTLAHELGHGYHGEVMKELPASQRTVPMGLAESASTLLEMIVEQAALRDAEGARELALLDGRMSRASAFMMNIPARFELEKRMHELRTRGRLHEDLLNEATREIFEEAYGEGVASVDELFWASKLHYFLTGMPFYNFPYTFGYLFSRAIYRRAVADPDVVDDRLDDLLLDTGRMRSEEVADKHLDADLSDPEFWVDAVGPLDEDLERYEELVDEFGE